MKSTYPFNFIWKRTVLSWRDFLASKKSSISGQVFDNDSSINESDWEVLISSLNDGHKSELSSIIDKKSVANSDRTYVRL